MKSLKGYTVNGNTNAGRESREKDFSDQLERAKQKYGDMSENALLAELKNQIEAQKRSGTYSSERMMSYVRTLEPYLNDEQKKRLNEIIGKYNA